MIYKHYCPFGTRVNKDYYILIFDQLRIHIRRKFLELIGCRILHQDIARWHVARLGLEYLEKHNIWTMTHPPCSPICYHVTSGCSQLSNAAYTVGSPQMMQKL